MDGLKVGEIGFGCNRVRGSRVLNENSPWGEKLVLLHALAGARISRTLDRSHSQVSEHAHDWPLLSLFVLGGYTNRTELGERYVCGPSAVLYRAGAHHANTVASEGFEQIEIEFDPAWLRCAGLPCTPVTHFTGGPAGAATRAMVRTCCEAPREEPFAAALRSFLMLLSRRPPRKPPEWLARASGRLRQDPALSVRGLAQELDRHPSWLGAAYRQAFGEGIPETATRLRVERAVRLLRESQLSYCEIAAEAGFCDQSHMNRSFRRAVGRAPSAVRDERSAFRELPI